MRQIFYIALYVACGAGRYIDQQSVRGLYLRLRYPVILCINFAFYKIRAFSVISVCTTAFKFDIPVNDFLFPWCSLHNAYQATALLQQYFFPLKSNVWLTLETLFYPLFWKWQKLHHQNLCNFWNKLQIVMKFWHLMFEDWYYPETIWIWQQWCHLYVRPEIYWVMC